MRHIYTVVTGMAFALAAAPLLSPPAQAQPSFTLRTVVETSAVLASASTVSTHLGPWNLENGAVGPVDGASPAIALLPPTLWRCKGVSAQLKSLELAWLEAPRLELGGPEIPSGSFPFGAAASRPPSQAASSDSLLSFGMLRPWRSLRFFAVLCLAVLALTFAEWRWMIARQNQLRVLVKERTRELEAEKTELLRAKAALAELACRDSLTGLYNRGAIFEVLEDEVKRARRERSSFAVVLTDLDNFKRVNDTYGHLIGDEVLREFGRRLRKNLRPDDHAGRFGGEELLILLPGMKDDSGGRIQELHRQITQEPFLVGNLALRITCSFGVAWFPAPLNTVESLLSLADQALYAAKANGRNRVEVAGRLSISRSGEVVRKSRPIA